MQLTHRFRLSAGIDAAWEAVNDPAELASCLPGATLSSHDGDGCAGTLKVKLGSIPLAYVGTARYVERDRAMRRFVVEAHGSDARGHGTATATLRATVRDIGDGAEVHVTTDLILTGRPAQFGSEVVADVSDKLIDQFVSALTARLAAPAPRPPALAEVPPSATETTMELPAVALAGPEQPNDRGGRLARLRNSLPKALRHRRALVGVASLATVVVAVLIRRLHR